MRWSDYRAVSGVQLPTLFTWKVGRWTVGQVRVVRQTIDGDVGNLAAPEAVVSAPRPAPPPPPQSAVREIAKASGSTRGRPTRASSSNAAIAWCWSMRPTWSGRSPSWPGQKSSAQQARHDADRGAQPRRSYGRHQNGRGNGRQRNRDAPQQPDAARRDIQESAHLNPDLTARHPTRSRPRSRRSTTRASSRMR